VRVLNKEMEDLHKETLVKARKELNVDITEAMAKSKKNLTIFDQQNSEK
jgi:hypothetical protein